MARTLSIHKLATLFTCAAGGLPLLACGSSDNPGCGALSAEIAGLSESAAVVNTQAQQLRMDVAGACAALAGEEMPDSVGEAELQGLCGAARQAIVDANIAATADVQVVIVPPVCYVNAQAQLSCEADCYAEAQVSCDPGSVEVRCDPGELSVVCDGTCDVGASCEGSVDVAVECAATCDGKCTGVCDGECSAVNAQGECVGNCEGTCTGTCNGSCEVTAEGGIECGVEARCKGGCSVDGSAPRCEAAIDPPQCEAQADVDCNASCEASGTFDAECTEPSIDVIVGANVEGDIADRLRAQLPTLVLSARRAALASESIVQLGVDLGRATGAVSNCGLQLVADFAATAQAALSATASVSVSFSASVDVSGSVTGGNAG